MKKCYVFFLNSNGKKNQRKGKKSAGFGGFAAVSLHFLNKHHKSNCHTKAQCCNSFLLYFFKYKIIVYLRCTF